MFFACLRYLGRTISYRESSLGPNHCKRHSSVYVPLHLLLLLLPPPCETMSLGSFVTLCDSPLLMMQM